MKKLNVILLLAFACSLHLSAQNTGNAPFLKFTNLHNSPVKLMFPATVTDGKYLYAINGLGGLTRSDFISKIYKYDPQADSWSIASKETKAKAMPAAAYLPGVNRAYVFGGMMDTFFEDNKIFQRVESVDLETGKIKDMGVINPMSSIGNWCAAWDGKIYLFGGTQAGGLTTSSLYRFDPETHEFTAMANMLHQAETTGAIVNGVLYTFGGIDRYVATAADDINAYDIKTNTWTQIGYMPEAISSNCIAVYHGLIFIIGNTDDETFIGYFDTFNKKFTRLQSNLQGRRAGGAAVIGNRLYVYGGKSGYVQDVGGGLLTVQCADLSQFAGLNPTPGM